MTQPSALTTETPVTGAGRYAPSPSGDLHLGNLRTALLAWLAARSTERHFWMRIEDLDRGRSGSAERQLADLQVWGITWDGPLMYQTARIDAYAGALERLGQERRVYECYCTRREIQEATRAPHSPPGAYPGTCRELTEPQREAARQRIAPRRPALRLRTDITQLTITDVLRGHYTGVVDDFVLQRGDGEYAYNFASVIDDAATGVDQVVRGDDLLASTPRQAHLQDLLGLPRPQYAHVPLVLGPDGRRLAKRDGAVTLADLERVGVDARSALRMVGGSLDLPGADHAAEAGDLLAGFDLSAVPGEPWVWHPPQTLSNSQ